MRKSFVVVLTIFSGFFLSAVQAQMLAEDQEKFMQFMKSESMEDFEKLSPSTKKYVISHLVALPNKANIWLSPGNPNPNKSIKNQQQILARYFYQAPQQVREEIYNEALYIKIYMQQTDGIQSFFKEMSQARSHAKADIICDMFERYARVNYKPSKPNFKTLRMMGQGAQVLLKVVSEERNLLNHQCTNGVFARHGLSVRDLFAYVDPEMVSNMEKEKVGTASVPNALADHRSTPTLMCTEAQVLQVLRSSINDLKVKSAGTEVRIGQRTGACNVQGLLIRKSQGYEFYENAFQAGRVKPISFLNEKDLGEKIRPLLLEPKPEPARSQASSLKPLQPVAKSEDNDLGEAAMIPFIGGRPSPVGTYGPVKPLNQR